MNKAISYILLLICSLRLFSADMHQKDITPQKTRSLLLRGLEFAGYNDDSLCATCHVTKFRKDTLRDVIGHSVLIDLLSGEKEASSYKITNPYWLGYSEDEVDSIIYLLTPHVVSNKLKVGELPDWLQEGIVLDTEKLEVDKKNLKLSEYTRKKPFYNITKKYVLKFYEDNNILEKEKDEAVCLSEFVANREGGYKFKLEEESEVKFLSDKHKGSLLEKALLNYQKQLSSTGFEGKNNKPQGYSNLMHLLTVLKVRKGYCDYRLIKKEYKGLSYIDQDSDEYKELLKKIKDQISSDMQSGLGVDIKDEFGQGALIYAIRARDKEIVDLLLQNNVEIESVDQSRNTALSEAAVEGCEDIVKLLVEKGADTESRDFANNTILMAAACSGSIPVLKFLLDNGVNINVQNINGQTALGYTLQGGDYDATLFLLDEGADISTIDDGGKTVVYNLVWALSGSAHSLILSNLELNECIDSKEEIENYQEVYDYYQERFNKNEECFNKNKDIAKMLFDKGIDINATDNKGETALMYAFKREGAKKAIEFLLENGANIHVRNSNNETVVMKAVVRWAESIATFKWLDEINNEFAGNWDVACKMDKEALELLLDKGVDVDAVNNNGETALMYAVKQGKKEIVEFLLNANASLAIKNNDGHTALDIALDSEIKELLLKAKSAKDFS